MYEIFLSFLNRKRLQVAQMVSLAIKEEIFLEIPIGHKNDQGLKKEVFLFFLLSLRPGAKSYYTGSINFLVSFFQKKRENKLNLIKMVGNGKNNASYSLIKRNTQNLHS